MSSHLKYMSYYYMLFIIEFIRVFFFFQAEDGIRDIGVTGVQTCAFLISSRRRHTRYWRDWSSDVCSSDLFARRPDRWCPGHGFATTAGRSRRPAPLWPVCCSPDAPSPVSSVVWPMAADV